MDEVAQGLCEICGGTGWEIVQEGNLSRAKRCNCSLVLPEEKRFNAAKIPSRYLSREFENYQPNEKFMIQGRARKLAMDYVADYPLLDNDIFHDTSILFTGGSGVGKTHLAVSILKGLLKKGVPSLFVDFHELLSEIRDSYDPLSETSELQILRPILNVELLLLDDLGSRRMSEWVQDTVFHIINLRYSRKKTLIATTNLKMEPLVESREETLLNRLGYRTVSRLYEMCTVIELDGPDFRRQDA